MLSPVVDVNAYHVENAKDINNRFTCQAFTELDLLYLIRLGDGCLGKIFGVVMHEVLVAKRVQELGKGILLIVSQLHRRKVGVVHTERAPFFKGITAHRVASKLQDGHQREEYSYQHRW